MLVALKTVEMDTSYNTYGQSVEQVATGWHPLQSLDGRDCCVDRAVILRTAAAAAAAAGANCIAWRRDEKMMTR